MFDWVCDEADLQGIMLFRSDPHRLIRFLHPIVQEGSIHVEYQKVRGGTIVAFSIEAISESRFNDIIAETGEEPVAMTFVDRISSAFTEPPPPIEECSDIPSVRAAMTQLNNPGMHIENREQAMFKAGDLWFNIGQAQRDFKTRQEFTQAVGEAWDTMQSRFLESAERLAIEAQYKTPDSGTERSRPQDNNPLGDQSIIHDQAAGTAVDDEKPRKAQSSKGATHDGAHGVSKGTELRYEDKVTNVLCISGTPKEPSDFNLILREALGGIGTETGAQPKDLFKQFSRALRVLGQQMGLGPLQDRLKSQGISWKQSDDGQAIILTIKNATTKADQPIARISHDTLAKPQEFEMQLKSMLDFATGDAPGAFAQKEVEVADRKKAIGDIAKAVMPQDEQGEVAMAMNTTPDNMNAGVGQEQQAAQTAAMPKQRAAQPVQPQQPVLAAGKEQRRSTVE